MIVLHRLAHAEERFSLNPDLIVSVEANPDSVVTLTTGTKILVCESPEAILEAVRAWRASVLGAALRDLPRRSAGLTLVRAAAGDEGGAPR
jgi:flagellar protein FlbD